MRPYGRVRFFCAEVERQESGWGGRFGVRELAPAFQSGGKPPRSKMSPCSRFPAPLFTRNACSSHSPATSRLRAAFRLHQSYFHCMLYHCRKVLRLYTGIRHTGGASVCLPLDEQTLVPPCVWDRPFSPYTFRQWCHFAGRGGNGASGARLTETCR